VSLGFAAGLRPSWVIALSTQTAIEASRKLQTLEFQELTSFSAKRHERVRDPSLAELIDPALRAVGDSNVDHHGYVRIRKKQTGGSKPDINQIP
jgi:hypothetical protein